MLWGISGLAWAFFVYGVTTRHLLPLRREPDSGPSGGRRLPGPQPAVWSVTRRAMRLLGWTPERLRFLSFVGAFSAGTLWLLLVQNLFASLAMAYVGWQLPSWWLETRASQGMAELHRQLAELVSLTHDQLHSRGATVERALMSAADTFTSGPLAPILHHYQRQTGTNTPLTDRLTQLREAIDLPVADFFIQLLRLRDQTGTEDMSHAFDSLDEKLQDDERVQAMIQGEVRMHALFLVLGLLVNLAIFPLYRLDGADWPAIHTHLQILVTGSALVTLLVFGGIRRITKTQLMAGAAG